LTSTARAIREGRNHELDYRMIAADGRTVWLHEIVNVIVENGVPSGLVGVSADITARKLAEESMALFGKLIDGSNDAIEVLDPITLHFLDINEKGCLDLGYHRQEMLCMIVYDIDPTLDQSVQKRVEQKLRKSGFVIMESLHQRKDGSTFPVEINIKFIQLDQGYLVAVVRDITERKLAEESLSKLSRRLIQAQELERSHVATELREDLNQQMALLHLGLCRLAACVPGLSSGARKQLDSISGIAAKVSAGIDNLSHQLHPSLLDLLDLVASLNSLCRELSGQHNLRVHFVHHSVPEHIPKDIALCLFRITQESLRNVVKHSGVAAAGVEYLGHHYPCQSGLAFGSRHKALSTGLPLSSIIAPVDNLDFAPRGLTPAAGM
jgi:PAS domain S-box-containing protein